MRHDSHYLSLIVPVHISSASNINVVKYLEIDSSHALLACSPYLNVAYATLHSTIRLYLFDHSIQPLGCIYSTIKLCSIQLILGVLLQHRWFLFVCLWILLSWWAHLERHLDFSIGNASRLSSYNVSHDCNDVTFCLDWAWQLWVCSFYFVCNESGISIEFWGTIHNNYYWYLFTSPHHIGIVKNIWIFDS
jgi:hypothetical protein